MDLEGLRVDIRVRGLLKIAEERLVHLSYASCWWCLVIHHSKTPFFRVEELHTVKSHYCCDEHLSEARSYRGSV
jgi:hypothetical protein